LQLRGEEELIYGNDKFNSIRRCWQITERLAGRELWGCDPILGAAPGGLQLRARCGLRCLDCGDLAAFSPGTYAGFPSNHGRPCVTGQRLLLAAYLVDIPAQHLALSAVWNRRRWILWLTGMLLAILFTNYWIADEIYPFVQ